MRVMGWILLFLWSVLLGGEHPKIIYLKLIPPKIDRGVYVGESLEVKYELLLFDGASLLDVEFIPNSNEKLAQGAELLNPKSPWKKGSNDAFENTLVFKIKSPQFALPTLKILALSKDGSYTDSALSDGLVMEAIELGGEFYCGVAAKKLSLTQLKAKKYDEWHNIVIFNLSAEGGNLEDFTLPQAIKQGYNGEMKGRLFKSGVYYAVLPNNLHELKFTYFNLQTLRYEDFSAPILVKSDQVSTQSDLEPKNTFLIFSNLLLGTLGGAALLGAFYLRRRRGICYTLLLLGIAMFVYMFLEFENQRTLTLLRDAPIAILPTSNSTIMETLRQNSKVQMIGEHGEFYKIKLSDSTIGWIKKDACE